ncbi:Nramp family divalent metal transporter [Brevibacterium yomogidense]|uniref:Nramp family divalent metal transporter n=1 Tax=Brevibacterium yomogidense TaxID=946573 RepID=UPI001E522F73|nr:Nramp family divalent metal transporter [Brevibacterium yomogidense]
MAQRNGAGPGQATPTSGAGAPVMAGAGAPNSGAGASAGFGADAPVAPRGWVGHLRMLGPGIVLALASVGASDMVTTLNSGAEYGLALIWVFTVGLLLKFGLSEAISRLQLTANRSFLSHVTDVGGRLFPIILLIAELLVGLFFGAGVAAITTLIVQALFPVLPFWPTLVVLLGSAVILLWVGRYGIVEKAMVGFAILMFLGIVALAIGSVGDGDAQQTAAATIMPVYPRTSLITVLSLIGGVGGATGIMAYTYFVQEKRWGGPSWKSIVRVDLAFSYILVGVFAIAMTVVGGFWLYGQGHSIMSNDAVFMIGDLIGERLGGWAWVLFLLSFFAVTYTSLLGGFQGIAYVTGDCLRVIRRYPHQDAPEHAMSSKTVEFKAALVWLTACTLVLLTVERILGFDRPVTLVLVYAAISSFILPILAIVLLLLLNRASVEPSLRNGWLSNTVLVVCLVLFTVLAGVQVVETVAGLL